MDNVLILEDYAASRLLLIDALENAFGHIDIIEAATVSDAKQFISHTHFNLAIIDLNLPDGSGIEVIKQLRASSPDTFCVVASVCDDDQHLFESLQAGAHGYILKEETRAELIRHLKGILLGQPPLSPSMAQKMISHFAVPTDHNNKLEVDLTDREKDVLQLISKGYARKEIARALEISIHTANDHVKSVYRKLDVSTSVEATLVAIEHGLS